MANILGFEVPTPDINVTGFLSSSWIYIFIVGFLGFLIVATIAVLLFFNTYKRKVVLFENIAGAGYQPILKTRARVINLGPGGEEVLKTLAGGKYVSAYGRKMGKNTYWYCKGSDGYWYNVILGDLDTKMGILDIEPIDRDVRMFHVAVDRLSQQNYGKQDKFMKYGIPIIMFIFLLILLGAFWVITGRVGDSTQALASTAETNERVADLLANILQGADNIATRIQTDGGGPSGLAPAG